ncbi:MAG: YihY family inner membrane protein [Rhodocyclaceae bacterium]|jgi:membrane protein|nr:YihY family inner membrane protein [Rhodocyclaceae bacterium]
MRLAGSLPDFLKRCLTRFREERCTQAAASLAFTTLLALVPLLTVALVLITHFDLFSGLGTALRNFLLANLLPEKAGKVIASYALQFSQKTGRLTVLGMGMLVATALLLLLSIDRVFGKIWRVRQPRPLLKRIFVYLGVLILGPVVLGASVAVATYLLTASLGLVNEPRWLTSLLLKILPAGLLAALCGLLYYAMPNRPVATRHAIAGGIVAAIGFALVQRGFGLYVSAFPSYTLIYGAFATVPIFLVWLYLSWLVVLVGALTTAVLGEMGSPRH